MRYVFQRTEKIKRTKAETIEDVNRTTGVIGYSTERDSIFVALDVRRHVLEQA